MSIRSRTCSATLAVLVAAVGLAMPASSDAADPALTVPQATLDAAVHCSGPKLKNTRLTPVLIVPGTGSLGSDIFWLTKGVWDGFGHPVCYVDLPDQTTGDIQIAAQYVVNAIRSVNAQARRKIAIFGISQGGLLPRWALTWWPGVRSMVDDVVALAGTQHGSSAIRDRYASAGCAPQAGCAPALWQQAAGSNLIKALDAYPDETPGSVFWTTVRSASDELVTPQDGAKPASSLNGAANILIQSVCPGRTTSHLGTLFDSVSIAAFTDAVTHSGPAKPSRLAKTVCDQRFAPGLNATAVNLVLSIASGRLDSLAVPVVAAEPPVAAYALGRSSGP